MRLGLAQKLIVLLTLAVAAVGTIAGSLSIRAEEQHLLRTTILGADQLSKGIISATWQAMLADHRQAAYEVMHTIALQQGINRIRMFNREGRTMFSTREGETNKQVGKTSETCAVCHDTLVPRTHVDAASRTRVFYDERGHRALTVVTPIYNEAACSQAACHAHPSSMKVLGVLDLSLDLQLIDEELSSAKLFLIAVFAAQVAFISVLIFLFMRRFLARPIHNLIEATETVSLMNLEEPIRGTESNDELGRLAQSFDDMRQRLRQALSEIGEFTQKLETKVAERTEQLKIANQKLMQTDRLASLGQLAASVAHEINNPISGVLNLSMLMQRILKDEGIPTGRVGEFRTYLGQVVHETSRVGRIVSDMLAFSRRTKPQRTVADLNAIVNSTLSLVRHKLKLSNVEVELDLDPDLPPIPCDASQMQQVILNLIMNAAEATQGIGSARVVTHTRRETETNSVVLVVSDNGEGIPEENLPKIFDPFFTTKPDGKGVGLGLAVAYGIVQSHGGEVTVQSKVGIGTTFTVTMPLTPQHAAQEAPSPAQAPAARA
jgi:two-component system, NtrC family, sensor kinase